MRTVAPKVYFVAEVITRAVTAPRIPRLAQMIDCSRHRDTLLLTRTPDPLWNNNPRGFI